MKREIKFLDLRITDESIRNELLSAINNVFLHGRIILGPEVIELENIMARICGRKHAVGVNSGTEALFFALKSLGIKAGDEVITTSLSWIATANAIALCGATPVFADIRDDLNIDPISIKELITPRTKVILPVHYTGKVCDMTSVMKITKNRGIKVIEDAAQSFGARHHGKIAGSFGDIACFSMNPMKVFAACGEAGMVLTDDGDIYDRLISLRYNGTVNREVCVEPSLNGRLDTIQAAILLKRFKETGNIIKKRRQNASCYNEQLKDVVSIPQEKEGEYDVYYTYTILANRRDKLKEYLESEGIETKIQHPYLMPEQPAYKLKAIGCFENAKRLVKQILSIPVNEKISREDIDYVISRIRKFYKK